MHTTTKSTNVRTFTGTHKSTNVRANNKRAVPLTRQLRRAAWDAARGTFSQLSWLAPQLALPLAERLFLSTQRHTPPAAELAGLRGARPVSLQRDGRPLEGWIWGDEGPLALLVHGWNGRASQMGALAQALAAAGWRAVAFDLSGHGRSGGRTATAVMLAEDVLHIAATLGPVQALVAHSFGAPVTALAMLAGLAPERAVFVAPPLQSRRWFEWFVETLAVHPSMVPALQRRLERRVGLAFDELNGELMAPRMHTPLLVLHDEDDREVPPAAGRRLAALWPGARFQLTQGLGHNRILRDEAAIGSAVQFITHPNTTQEPS